MGCCETFFSTIAFTNPLCSATLVPFFAGCQTNQASKTFPCQVFSARRHLCFAAAVSDSASLECTRIQKDRASTVTGAAPNHVSIFSLLGCSRNDNLSDLKSDFNFGPDSVLHNILTTIFSEHSMSSMIIFSQSPLFSKRSVILF